MHLTGAVIKHTQCTETKFPVVHLEYCEWRGDARQIVERAVQI